MRRVGLIPKEERAVDVPEKILIVMPPKAAKPAKVGEDIKIDVKEVEDA